VAQVAYLVAAPATVRDITAEPRVKVDPDARDLAA